jgi:hypothetical protein
VSADRATSSGSSRYGEVGRRKIPVDIEQRHCGCESHSKPTTFKGNFTGNSFFDEVTPAGLSKLVRAMRRDGSMGANSVRKRQALSLGLVCQPADHDF